MVSVSSHYDTAEKTCDFGIDGDTYAHSRTHIKWVCIHKTSERSRGFVYIDLFSFLFDTKVGKNTVRIFVSACYPAEFTDYTNSLV